MVLCAHQQRWQQLGNFTFTARIRRIGKVFSQVSVYPQLGRGYPSPRSLVPGPFRGVHTGVPSRPGQDVVPPSQVRMGYPPQQVMMGYPPVRSGWGTLPSRSGWGTPPPPKDRTAERTLATWRLVCLLRSSRTFFYFTIFEDEIGLLIPMYWVHIALGFKFRNLHESY